MINAQLTGDRIYSSSLDSFSLCEKSSFGEKKDRRIEYSFVEALYLLSINKMTIHSGKKIILFEPLLLKLKKIDKGIESKFIVFSDLRKKGYVVKAALKYGADFRVYDKGQRPSTAHARWILFVTKESSLLNWQDFAAKNRIAHSVKKNLLIAIVDQESDITYYEVRWTRP